MFFGVIARPQTWRNVGYLLLAFPLGIFYFVFLVTGLSLGFGLFITLLGIPILLGVLAAAYGMGDFERMITNVAFDQETPPAHRLAVSGGIWSKVKALIGSSETWKRVWYLFVEFPLGIIGFTLVTTAVATASMVATPIFYRQSWWPSAFDWPEGFWLVDTFWEALVVAALAVFVTFILIHVINGLATVWAIFAKTMLGPTERFGPAEETVPARQLEEAGV